MYRTLLKSKLHAATVTGADLHYEGSIGIDASLLDAAAIQEHEQVHVYNITNGERFVTYAIRADSGSGEIRVNGAAARRVAPGDTIIIASYAAYDEEEATAHRPRILLMGDGNQPLSTR